ncbi:MAG: MFS transporter [Alphaproteobacteria bacterium]|nr:MFS transporter [Alphaproteobacteria bacterium]
MKKVVTSGMIGNGLEWYDYALYGQVAWLLSKLFFPEGDAFAQTLAVYGVFAAGFIVRPLGAVFFGWLGDRYGRRLSMVVAILMMALPTGAIGLLPTYAEIGILAPILLIVIRLLQGMSLGGEFSGSIAYIVEHAPPHRRGLAGAASLVSMMLGFLLGLMVVKGMIYFIGEDAFEAWGWRVPFLAGIIIGLVGFYIRHHCGESPAYEKAKEDGAISEKPVRHAFSRHRWQMVQGFAMYITVTMPFYLTTVYFIGFSKLHLEMDAEHALMFGIYNMLALLFAMPFSAWLSDHIGRRKVMIASALVMALMVYPLFGLMVPGAPPFTIGAVQFAFALVLGIYVGPVAAVLVELFPTSVRFSGMAITYNLCAAIFGGTSPMVCEWLVGYFGDARAIAYYVIAGCIASLTALFFYQDRYKEPL